MFWRERSSCTRITEFLRMVMMPGVVPEARKFHSRGSRFSGHDQRSLSGSIRERRRRFPKESVQVSHKRYLSDFTQV